MAPELYNTMDAQELVSLGLKIREWQEFKELSTNAMIKKFSDLGSDKTYRRVCDNDLSELDLDKQLERYRAVWALIESMEGSQEREEELYEDLAPAAMLRKAFVETMRETSNARMVFLIAPQGSGKTFASRVLQSKFGQRVRWIEANECWNDNPNALLKEILGSYGVRDIPPAPMDRLALVLQKLNQTRTCLVIDEGHHMGPRCLNTVKTLINQSPGEFMALALDTLWARFERSAYEEVRQLTGNRLAEKITIAGIREKDIEKMVGRRVPAMAKEQELMPKVVKLLANHAPTKGNFSFVRQVIKKVLEKIEGMAGPDLECWTTAISQELAKRQ